MAERLTLPEEFLLLCWNDERGRNGTSSQWKLLVAGAALMDLALRDLVTVEDRVSAGDRDSGEPPLDAALDAIRTGRSRSAKAWVQRLGNRSVVADATLDRLVDRGVLRREQRRILGLLPITRHPVAEGSRVEALRRRVGRLLTSDEEVDDPHDAALGALVEPAGATLRNQLVDRQHRKHARARSKALARGEGLSADVANAVRDANAAALAAIAATSAASSGSSGGSN